MDNLEQGFKLRLQLPMRLRLRVLRLRPLRPLRSRLQPLQREIILYPHKHTKKL
jgi:hypothetical protein